MPREMGGRGERIEALQRASLLVRDAAMHMDMDSCSGVGAWMYEIAAELEQRAWGLGSVEPKRVDGKEKKDGL